MHRDDLHQSEPPKLAKVLSIGTSATEVLPTDELAAIFQHQLDAPLELDLGSDNTSAAGLRAGATFGELLADPRPSVDLLNHAKRFAKACKIDPDGPLPVQVASGLYFAAIAKALVAHGARISALSDAQLHSGVRWALEQSWITGSMRELFEQAAKTVNAGKSASD